MTDPLPSEGEALVGFIEVMRRLRAECNWKAAQTHRSLARYLLEETYETLEAIDSGDPAKLREELGDLLLQIYFHAAIAAEQGEFTIDDVAAGLQAKMIRRNPHVFGTDEQRRGRDRLDPAEIDAAWQRIKSSEGKAPSLSRERAPAYGATARRAPLRRIANAVRGPGCALTRVETFRSRNQEKT